MHAGAQLHVEAWDRELKNRLGQGLLETIDNQIDPTTGTLRLRALFENKAGKLFPSQFVNARLLVEEKTGIVVVPNAAIQRNTSSTYVWLIKPDSTVTVRPVTVGVTEGDNTEITTGLEAGDEMVTVGVDRLIEGSQGQRAGSGRGSEGRWREDRREGRAGKRGKENRESFADIYSASGCDFPADGGNSAGWRSCL